MTDDLTERMIETGARAIAAIYDQYYIAPHGQNGPQEICEIGTHKSVWGPANFAAAELRRMAARACLAAALRAWEPDEDDADSAAQDFDLRGPYIIEVVARIAREMSRDIAYKLDKAND